MKFYLHLAFNLVIDELLYFILYTNQVDFKRYRKRKRTFAYRFADSHGIIEFDLLFG